MKRALLLMTLLLFGIWALVPGPAEPSQTTTPAPVQPASAPVPWESSDFAESIRLYQAGKFIEAIPKYQEALKANPIFVAAQAGLVLANLRLNETDHALELAKTCLSAQPNAALLMAAMGRVQ